MAIKFGMTVAEMIAQLIRGFRSVTGRDPDGLERIKIQQEAVQRFKDMNKIVDMQGRTLDPSKTIMGGTQEGAALQSGIMKATGAKPTKAIKDFKKKMDEDRDYSIFDPEDMAEGGRIGYKLGSIDKARRAFLKTMGAAGAGIGALKTGILGLGEKVAPMVEAARETVTQAPSYFFDLVAKIKMLGKPGMSISERQNVTVYKNYELTEDVATGDIRITKQKGDPDAPGYKEEVMEYNKGGNPTEEGISVEQYDEATLFPDMDGKMKDIEDGIEPDSIQEIIEETTKEAPSIKKAGGGIATMLGE